MICAVINVTPDSFSDGGRFASVDAAVGHGLRCIEEGADWLDVGGESTRPGASAVTVEEEIRRVVSVVRGLSGRAPISVDTTKSDVARAALDAGAEIVNDVSGGLFDPEILEVTERAGAAYVCGHLRGRALAEVHASHQADPSFDDIVWELNARLANLPADLRARTVVDPGIGFGKQTPLNLELLRRSGELSAALLRPVMVGPSRKRFLGDLTGQPTDTRDDATVGACLAAVAAGAHVLRVHDVRRLKDALAAFQSVRGWG